MEIHIDDSFNASIRDVSSQGDGIAVHRTGMIFLVPGVWPGDVGRFRVTGLKNSYGTARLEQLHEPSEARVKPVCPHHGFAVRSCRGCPWQFVNYSEQLKAKSRRLRNQLKKVGLNYTSKVCPIWASPHLFGYRNRAQLKTDGYLLGYVGARAHHIAPIEDCPILTDKNRRTLWCLLKTLPREDFKPSRFHQWNTLEIDEDVGPDTLKLNTPRPFRQANTEQNQRMKEWLERRLGKLEDKQSIIELFAGTGNFTTVLSAARFKRILAVEIQQKALAELEARRLPNVQPLTYNLFAKKAIDHIATGIPTANAIVLNPPRDGLKDISAFIHRLPTLTHIFYISCDVATFVRDASNLFKLGFAIVEIQPLDQFPHTPHLELLAYLRKQPPQ